MGRGGQPVNGYKSEAKDKYRHTVWKTFAEYSDPKRAVCLLMPSKGGSVSLMIKRRINTQNILRKN